ncbi:hypothetical protein E1301_Tti008655 [Triplophysa tibetana]|uniref:Uncharacterized protein n=1 Tax=Triplophysa tibetana TaxID=1572043 RepID=A0A5A9PM18_9TELE|nr:hypothetical protein E1301_Tti008655 [Triplophysa tibetana]
MKLILAVLMLVMVVRAQKNAKGTISRLQRLPLHMFIGNHPERKSPLQSSLSETLERSEPASENRRILHLRPNKDFRVEDKLPVRSLPDANRKAVDNRK